MHYARASSIIEKYTNKITLPKMMGKLEASEIELLRTLAKWPKIVEETSDNLKYIKFQIMCIKSPQILTNLQRLSCD